MSSLADFLKKEYAPRFDVQWNETIMSLRLETPASVRFEIEDKKPTIVQPPGHGVSVIRRSADAVEVIDLEDYMKQIHGEDNTPSSCDFAI